MHRPNHAPGKFQPSPGCCTDSSSTRHTLWRWRPQSGERQDWGPLETGRLSQKHIVHVLEVPQTLHQKCFTAFRSVASSDEPMNSQDFYKFYATGLKFLSIFLIHRKITSENITFQTIFNSNHPFLLRYCVTMQFRTCSIFHMLSVAYWPNVRKTNIC